MSEDRFIALETKIAFQEQTIEELNGAMYQQQKQIIALEKQLSLMQQQVSQLKQSGGDDMSITSEPPPHY